MGTGIEYYVRRELLIGKALFIYWPHSWENIPFTSIHNPLYDPLFAPRISSECTWCDRLAGREQQA